MRQGYIPKVRSLRKAGPDLSRSCTRSLQKSRIPLSIIGRKLRRRGGLATSVIPQAAPHLTAQVAFELARRGLAHTSAAAAAKANVANLLLQYGALGALCASIATWIVFVTGQLYQQIQPEIPEVKEVWLHGVLVTSSKVLNQPLGRRAADFAANAHAGQTRLTGHPYVTHVIEAALIVEGILGNSCSSFALGERAEMAVVTALLHDVLDDTSVTEEQMREEFGREITEMVKKVSRLSALNQLLRRKRRKQHESGNQASWDKGDREETTTLQNMLVLMSDEPLVIVVKLADRLHNMRTTYALAPNKRRAVSLETLEVWCSLAERLGMFAIKSELEDLCFATLDPARYRELYLERNDLWQKELLSPAVQEEADRALARSQEHIRGPESINSAPASTSGEQLRAIARDSKVSMRKDDRFVPQLERKDISTHLPPSQGLFGEVAEGTRQMLSRGEQAILLQQAKLQRQFLARRQQDQPPRYWLSHHSPKHRKERSYQLEREQEEVRDLLSTVLRFDDTTYKLGSTSFADETADLAGLQACADRLIYEINVEAVATGLQVKIEGRLKSLNSVWRKMQRKKAALAEIYDARALRIIVDDRFGQQKQSAIEACYSLLTTVQQLWKKVSTEDDDDYIANPKPSGYQSLHTAVIGPGGAPLEVQIRTSSMHEVAEYGRAAHWTYKEHTPSVPTTTTPGMLYRGQPVMKSKGGKLNLGVVLEWDEETRRCLVAINVNSRPNPGSPVSKERISELIREVEENGWCRPGDGNFSYYLEMFAFYRDRKFHNTDVYNARRSATLIPLAVEADKLQHQEKPTNAPRLQTADPVAQAQQKMDEKIRLLREVLEWGEIIQKSMDADDYAAMKRPAKADKMSQKWTLKGKDKKDKKDKKSDDFVVLVFPEGDFQVVPEGTTAADIIDQKELVMDSSADCRVVNVNNLLVPEDTPLRKGDFIIRSRQLQDI